MFMDKKKLEKRCFWKSLTEEDKLLYNQSDSAGKYTLPGIKQIKIYSVYRVSISSLNILQGKTTKVEK